jgi:hypothetical protein
MGKRSLGIKDSTGGRTSGFAVAPKRGCAVVVPHEGTELVMDMNPECKARVAKPPQHDSQVALHYELLTNRQLAKRARQA